MNLNLNSYDIIIYYNVDMLTYRVYIVKYRQSILSVTFILTAISWLAWERKATKHHKSLFVAVLNITLCSLDVNISAIRSTASDKGQERRYPWKTRTYIDWQRVQFVISGLTIFAALPRRMDRSNVKLDEDVKRLFYSLQAMFRAVKLSMQ